jgi:hypothetical protein
MEWIFRIVRRINSVLFLLVILGVGGLILFYIVKAQTWHRADQVTAVEMDADQSPREVTLRFSGPETIAGTQMIMLRLQGDVKSSGFSGSKGEYGDTRNVLFVGNAGSGSWLFPKSNNRNVDVKQVARNSEAQSRQGFNDNEKEPTRLLLVSFVGPEDAESPSGHIPMRLALAKPDGSPLVEVLSGVDEILVYWITPTGLLMVVYQSGATVHQALYDVDTFKEMSNVPVAELPKTL